MFELGPVGRYFVANGKILLRDFCLFCKADIVSLKFTPDKVFFKKFSGQPLLRSLCLNSAMFSLNLPCSKKP